MYCSVFKRFQLFIFTECGKNTVTDKHLRNRESSPRAYDANTDGGDEAGPERGSWPWLASLGRYKHAPPDSPVFYCIGATVFSSFRFHQGKWQHLCGGTLVSENHVLTGAHCVTPNV